MCVPASRSRSTWIRSPARPCTASSTASRRRAAQEFALLPPDNATGNFTKIVQRVPVKITIDPHDPLIGRLRPGMSVEPTIDTRPRERLTRHDAATTPRPRSAVSLKTWIAVGGALIGAFMAVLNIQVTNSSLPDIEGGIGTGGVNGAWIITAYLIGEIIVIPMTDFLSRVFSLRRYLIANTALFLLFSVACGQAHSLPEMIVLRGLAGVLRRRADPAGLHHHRHHAAAVEARRWASPASPSPPLSRRRSARRSAAG